jgi:hypothetical protein
MVTASRNAIAASRLGWVSSPDRHRRFAARLAAVARLQLSKVRQQRGPLGGRDETTIDGDPVRRNDRGAGWVAETTSPIS